MSDLSSEAVGLSPLKGLASGLDQGLQAWRAMQAMQAAQGSKEDIADTQAQARQNVANTQAQARRDIAGIYVGGRHDIQELKNYAANIKDQGTRAAFLLKEGVTPDGLPGVMQDIEKGIKAGSLGPNADNSSVSTTASPPQGGSQATQSAQPSGPNLADVMRWAGQAPPQGAQPTGAPPPTGMTVGDAHTLMGQPPLQVPPPAPPMQGAPAMPSHAHPQIDAAIQAALNHPTTLQAMQQAIAAAQPLPQQSITPPGQGAPGTLGGPAVAPGSLTGQGGAVTSQPLPGVQAGINKTQAQATHLQAQDSKVPAQIQAMQAATQHMRAITTQLIPAQVKNLDNEVTARTAATNERAAMDQFNMLYKTSELASKVTYQNAQLAISQQRLSFERDRLTMAQTGAGQRNLKFQDWLKTHDSKEFNTLQMAQDRLKAQASTVQQQYDKVNAQASEDRNWVKANQTFTPDTSSATPTAVQHQKWMTQSNFVKGRLTASTGSETGLDAQGKPATGGQLQHLASMHNSVTDDYKKYDELLKDKPPLNVLKPGSLQVDRSATRAANARLPAPVFNPGTRVRPLQPGRGAHETLEQVKARMGLGG